MVITQYYGHLQKQMNPHPKFGLVIETDDVIHTTEGYERLVTYIIESLGRAGQASQAASEWLKRAGKGGCPGFYCSLGQDQEESFWVQAEDCVI